MDQLSPSQLQLLTTVFALVTNQSNLNAPKDSEESAIPKARRKKGSDGEEPRPYTIRNPAAHEAKKAAAKEACTFRALVNKVTVANSIIDSLPDLPVGDLVVRYPYAGGRFKSEVDKLKSKIGHFSSPAIQHGDTPADRSFGTMDPLSTSTNLPVSEDVVAPVDAGALKDQHEAATDVVVDQVLEPSGESPTEGVPAAPVPETATDDHEGEPSRKRTVTDRYADDTEVGESEGPGDHRPVESPVGTLGDTPVPHVVREPQTGAKVDSSHHTHSAAVHEPSPLRRHWNK